MSSAGAIFNEQVFSVTSDAKGSKTIPLVVDNEGCIVTVQRISGTAKARVDVYSNLPSPMTKIKECYITVPSNVPVQDACITSKVLSLQVAWDGPITLGITVRGVSGAAVGAFHLAVDDTTEADVFRDKVVSSLDCVESKLQAILNHQRQITDIESDEGEIF